MRAGGKNILCAASATQQTYGGGVGGATAGPGYRISTFGNPGRAIMDANGITCPTITQKTPNITCFSRVRRTDVLIIIPES